ncbi:hypothetical protein Pla52o_36620 [Novipirellula galeiformis]|uniref:Transmembrane protein n=1 Tax=Novipirellula galeiformis TaxID=2528004 RepID=A0A5C6CDN4_9BACT|nr:hypothetical protein [Novipirellula galeiformis]TWU21476.1 hypothetical protein Pla52o_36620 [Novipirellula galeiformis]
MKDDSSETQRTPNGDQIGRAGVSTNDSASDANRIVIAALVTQDSTDSPDSTHSAPTAQPAASTNSVGGTASSGEQQIRVGSPFATEPEPNPQAVQAEDIYFQATPLRYTSIGAVVAATMVVFFAVAATAWFPVGGTMIAGLGCLLSILGLYSHLRVPAAGLLAVHLVLFVTSYSRILA